MTTGLTPSGTWELPDRSGRGWSEQARRKHEAGRKSFNACWRCRRKILLSLRAELLLTNKLIYTCVARISQQPVPDEYSLSIMIRKAYKLKDLRSINFALCPGFVLIPGGLRRLPYLPISTTLLSQTRFPDRGLFTERGNGQSLRWPGRKVSVLVI